MDIPPNAAGDGSSNADDRPTKRMQVIDAARALFLRRGYEATTIADIAAAANVAVGSVYRYVHDKRDLLEAVREYVADGFATRIREAIAGTGPELDRIDRMVNVIFEEAFRKPAATQFLFLAPTQLSPNGTAAGTAPQARDAGTMPFDFEPIVDALVPLLRRQVVAGRITVAVARMESALAHGEILAALRSGIAGGPEAVGEWKSALRQSLRRRYCG